MPPDTARDDITRTEPPLWPMLRRFLPYLWPAGEPALKARIIVALLLVLGSKLVQVYGAPFALQGVVNDMAKGDRGATSLIVALVVGYAAARFGTVLFDNLRNAVFERVGQDATRRLAATVFRHLHQLSLRFHLERRTGAVTKVVERGTKSIDTMLYFLLFNIAPTVLELGLVLQIFYSQFGLWMVVSTLVMVSAYIWFTRVVTDWRNALRA
ncbi:MAG: ABC transporter transmembrane domain-containing protein, partial [Sphingomonas sp.]